MGGDGTGRKGALGPKRMKKNAHKSRAAPKKKTFHKEIPLQKGMRKRPIERRGECLRVSASSSLEVAGGGRRFKWDQKGAGCSRQPRETNAQTISKGTHRTRG